MNDGYNVEETEQRLQKILHCEFSGPAHPAKRFSDSYWRVSQIEA
jgi:hypothetical protein